MAAEAGDLFDAGELIYLPSSSDINDEFNSYYPGANYGSFRSKFNDISEGTFENFQKFGYSGDPFKEQMRRVAQEVIVSNHLGCSHAFETRVNYPLILGDFQLRDLESAKYDSLLNRITSLTSNSREAEEHLPGVGESLLRGMISKLDVGDISALTFDEIKRLKIDNSDSFREITVSINKALAESAKYTKNSTDSDLVLADIQKKYLDEPVLKVKFAIDRAIKQKMQMTSIYGIQAGASIIASLLTNYSASLSMALGIMSVPGMISALSELHKAINSKSDILNSNKASYIFRLFEKTRKS